MTNIPTSTAAHDYSFNPKDETRARRDRREQHRPGRVRLLEPHCRDVRRRGRRPGEHDDRLRSERSTPTRPDSYYGASKAACEGLRTFYADTKDLEVVNLRIGWYMSEDDLREEMSDDTGPGRTRFARAYLLATAATSTGRQPRSTCPRTP